MQCLIELKSRPQPIDLVLQLTLAALFNVKHKSVRTHRQGAGQDMNELGAPDS